MITKTSKRLLLSALIAVLAMTGLAVAAQNVPTANAQVYFAGSASDVSDTAITVQGVTFAITADTQIKGLDATGAVVDLTTADIASGDTVTVYAEDVDGTPTADVIFAGSAFRIAGNVTAIQTDADGNAQFVIDDTYTVNVAGTTFYGSDGTIDAGTIQVGDEVVLRGIVADGVFTGVYGSISGGQASTPTVANGFILNLTTDDTGAVTGFTMTSKHAVTTVVLDPSTKISKRNHDADASDLSAGLHVKVWGSTQPDGSVLASTILIEGGQRH